MDKLIALIKQRYVGQFMTIAVTGSVSVGKSTFAETISKALGIQVKVISTDHFLMSNQTLIAQDLFGQKGFPQTYDLESLEQVIKAFKQGEKSVEIPIYTQENSDIDPNNQQIIERPDILIIEGVVALRLKQTDFKIYLEADLEDIKWWYLSRTLAMTAQAKDNKSSWRYQYTTMPIGELADLTMKTWDETNQVNLDNYILPSKQYADVVVYLDKNHDVEDIKIKD
ncbi:type I pantothenate kinase [Leuconostoc carnosum]|uniref:Pantothenate kinase n=2 Tax=Leuconostoc carnosum TaxID=1252 RepID=K0DAW2_LEUCJ|nr:MULTISPECIES: type I pantothenate kinase [Leuconostoc]AFT81051.1 pantothenate kinase [Leuconostoc carnosum JB16]KAA8327274.1 type I pantothenate kinase [Leuconostoc carnosum]KAA8332416.1 type I pantothenate kinase [Leuconostoc carnosum]KAA8364363.1 type I pantothenate kinase [Leuconostoc carnosum]KAA8367255.1 type I pantothenate kinase [Leuconostoc carnosum]